MLDHRVNDDGSEPPREGLETRWVPARPTDIAVTLSRLARGSGDPTQRTSPDGAVWRILRTVDGQATVRLSQRGPLDLGATGWGPGARAALDAAPALLGSEDDPTGFLPRHPVLEQAHRRFPGLRIGRTDRMLDHLIAAVLEQRVTGGQALAAWRVLVIRAGSPAPGPAPAGMRVPPSADAWAAIPGWAWHRAGVDGRRAEAIVAIARRADSIERLTVRPAAEARAALRSLPGVGVWTAAEVTQRSHGDADVLSIGDFHLAGVVGHVLFGRPFTDAQMVEALEPWRPHRYRLARLLFASGHESVPRRGPRAPIADHRDR